MLYVFILIIAVGIAWIASIIATGVTASKSKSKTVHTKENKKPFKPFTKRALLFGVLFFVLFTFVIHSLFEGIMYGVATYFASLMVEDIGLGDKLSELQAVLGYAQTVFPLLGSNLSNGVVSQQASISLPTEMRGRLQQARNDVDDGNEKDALLLFAAREGSKEIDIIASIVSSAFGTDGTKFNRESGEVAISIFTRSIDMISKTMASQRDAVSTARFLVFMLPAVSLFLGLFGVIGGGASNPLTASSPLTLIGPVMGAIILVISSIMARKMLKPRVEVRLIEPEVVFARLESRRTMLGAESDGRWT